NAQDKTPNVSDIVKYARSSGGGNVTGAPGIGSEDMRYLLALLDAQKGKSDLAAAVESANSALNNPEYAHVTGDPRTALAAKANAAQQTLEASSAVLYDYSLAQLELAEAYDAFMEGGWQVGPGMSAH